MSIVGYNDSPMIREIMKYCGILERSLLTELLIKLHKCIYQNERAPFKFDYRIC